jgi:hypothetical protein
MNSQIRLLLEVCYEAILDAGKGSTGCRAAMPSSRRRRSSTRPSSESRRSRPTRWTHTAISKWPIGHNKRVGNYCKAVWKTERGLFSAELPLFILREKGGKLLPPAPPEKSRPPSGIRREISRAFPAPLICNHSTNLYLRLD